MIITEIYNGQGLGNQLFCYIMARVIALDKDYDFGIMSPEKFKGKSFMQLDFGKNVLRGESKYEGAPPTQLPEGIYNYFWEKKLLHPNGADIRSYDQSVWQVKDNTKIDGLFQGENYFKHRKNEIRKWLGVETIAPTKNCCIINFRGGEYIGSKNLFLEQGYWDNAIKNMQKINPKMTFRVVTDDPKMAKIFFPTLEISHNIKDDYISIQYAEYLILSNSSFAFFPAWLNQNVKYTIAPKYWARHNVSDGYWSCSYNIAEGWTYQDTEGRLFDSALCEKELNSYMKKHEETFIEIEENILKEKEKARIKNIVSRYMPKKLKKLIKNLLKIR